MVGDTHDRGQARGGEGVVVAHADGHECAEEGRDADQRKRVVGQQSDRADGCHAVTVPGIDR